MIDRIAIAKRYVQEQVQNRDDIVGVYLSGSAARGEDTEASDIDLSFFLLETSAIAGQRGEFSTWRDGIYIDVGTRVKTAYEELEKVLADPFLATHIYHGHILYDPTGFLTELQINVRAEYMKPKWLLKRIQFFGDEGQSTLSRLKEAVEIQDALSICHLGWFAFTLISMILLYKGLVPSSSRALIQLGRVDAGLRDQICELEGSSTMRAEDVLALIPICSGISTLAGKPNWGQLPDYFVKKATWMAHHDQHRGALHAMWLMNSAGALECQQRNHAQELAEATRLAKEWIHGVNWEGEAVGAAKMQLATLLLESVKAQIVVS